MAAERSCDVGKMRNRIGDAYPFKVLKTELCVFINRNGRQVYQCD